MPILTTIKDRCARINISNDIYKDGVIITADTGFSNDANNRYLRDEGIDAYIPDNQFRSRDPKFKDQKQKYGKRHQEKTTGLKQVIPASAFTFDEKRKTCRCPAGNDMLLYSERPHASGKVTLCFEGRLTDCRHCPLKTQCMRNPESADSRKGHGRQVQFTINHHKSATAWMKKRIDSRQGKVIYGHRMSTVEPVFGNIGTNKGLNRFSLRGKAKVQGQWQLYCLVHNIEKIMNFGEIH